MAQAAGENYLADQTHMTSSCFSDRDRDLDALALRIVLGRRKEKSSATCFCPAPDAIMISRKVACAHQMPEWCQEQSPARTGYVKRDGRGHPISKDQIFAWPPPNRSFDESKNRGVRGVS